MLKKTRQFFSIQNVVANICLDSPEIDKKKGKIFTSAIPSWASVIQSNTILIELCLQKVYCRAFSVGKSRSLYIILRGTIRVLTLSYFEGSGSEWYISTI